MPYISDEIIEQIRSKIDIADVIAPYTELKRAGSRLKALCPFHNEKTPSFIVSKETQTFHCFGCGKGGNVFTFLMAKENLTFPESLKLLADRCGVIIPENTSSPQSQSEYEKQKKLKEKLITIHKIVAKWYSERLFREEGKQGLDYLKTRNISEEIISRFALGFAPDSWDSITKLLTSLSFAQSEMLESGLVLKSESADRIYDRFRNRITFPIWDEHGDVVGFSSRTILKETKEGKYINSPETPIFKKSKILYAYHIAKKDIKERGFAILCEGQIDVISMHRAGFTNAVAPQGTAFTEEQAKMLKRLTERVYLCFDGDNAGSNAALKALDILLPLGVEVKVITLPEGEDPDSLYNKSGSEGIKNVIDRASDFIDFMLSCLSKNKDMSSPVAKSHIVTEIFDKISKIQDQILRTTYVSVVSEKLGLPKNMAFDQVKRLNSNKPQAEGNFRKSAEFKAKDIQTPQTTTAEKLLLRLVIEKDGGEIARIIEENLPVEMISASPIGNALNLAISMTMNGEWEDISKKLSLLINENPENSILAQILAQEDLPYNDNNTRLKACMDCIRSIKIFHIREKVDFLIKELKTLEAEEEKEAKMAEIVLLQKEQMKLRKS